MIRTAAILIGGQARRLGGLDKSRLVVGGRTIVARQLELLAPLVDRVVLIGPTGDGDVPAGIEVRPDARPGSGSLGGLYTALLTAGGSPVLVLACDMPFLTAPFLAFVRDQLGDADAAVPRTRDGWHPLCAMYGHGCLAAIEAQLDAGQLKIADALARVRVRAIDAGEIEPFDPDGRLLANLNTPDDLARARVRAGEGGV